MVFYSGIDRCVVYTSNRWSQWVGITSMVVEETGEDTTLYLDGYNTLVHIKHDTYKSSISAYTYPEIILDGVFNLVYRVYDTLEQDSYELHIVYNVKAALGGYSSTTMTKSSTPTHFNINIHSRPTSNPIGGMTPSAHFIIRTRDIWPEAVEHVENLIYGSDDSDPYFPTLEELIEILESYSYLRVTNHGDGTWTAEELQPIGAISLMNDEEFSIDWASAIFIDDETYTIQSL